MTPSLHGLNLIAGDRVASGDLFHSAPLDMPSQAFHNGTAAMVDRAAHAAKEAFATLGWTAREDRARLLERIADAIEAQGPAITRVAMAETGLPEARLNGERGRTTGQLRLFAAHVRKGDYLDRRHDPALPDRQPLPRPDLRMIQRPVGPVGVFGASNFPLAFSVAGGDTVAALAAGCPVVVKGHPAHPGTCELVAEAVAAAVAAEGLPGGVFSMIHGDGPAVGAALVTHPAIRAVGFTGSMRGGRALFDLCAARPDPIPFFGELGSVNPVFVLPQALAARGVALAQGWAGSLAMGAGQFCTNPGILILPEGPAAEDFIAAALAALSAMGEQVMLTDAIAEAYRAGCARAARVADAVLSNTAQGRRAAPALVRCSAETFAAHPELAHEVFGPLGVIVTVQEAADMPALAAALQGQLTATIQMDPGDIPLVRRLMPVLERLAGRVLANGWPTGVEVADAMVHGGPYPASTNFGATSVGTLSIRRFLRPVCFQNLPEALLPDDLLV